MDDIWTWLWLGWVAVFFAIEVPASVNKHEGDTLSEHIWRLLGTTRKEPLDWQTRLRRIILMAASAWAIAHLFFQWA